MTLSAGNSVVTLTLTGNANNHFDSDDVSDLTFEFDDTAFTASLAADVDAATGPYSSGWGINFAGLPSTNPSPTAPAPSPSSDRNPSGGCAWPLCGPAISNPDTGTVTDPETENLGSDEVLPDETPEPEADKLPPQETSDYPPHTFTDVPSNWKSLLDPALDRLMALDVVLGENNDRLTSNVKENINRAGVAAAVSRTFNIKPIPGTDCGYPDFVGLPLSTWYFEFACGLKNPVDGRDPVMTGQGNGEFDAESDMNVAEFSQMIYNLMGWDGSGCILPETGKFKGVSDPDWFHDSMCKMNEEDMFPLSLYQPPIKPGDPVKRGHVFYGLYKAALLMQE